MIGAAARQPGNERMLQALRAWEDVLTLVVDPDTRGVHDLERGRRLLEALLQRAGIDRNAFWQQPPAARSRTFLGHYSKVSRGLPQLEITSFDVDRAAKERFRQEPLTIGAAWHHGYWRSYFSHAAITHPANDGLREEFSTAWDILRRRHVITQHGEHGVVVRSLPSIQLDLPVLVGPVPHSDGLTLERAWIEATRRRDPDNDLRIGTRVLVDSATYRMYRDYYRSVAAHLIVRLPVEELAPNGVTHEAGGWEVVREVADPAGLVEVAVGEGTTVEALRGVLRRLQAKHPALLVSVYLGWSTKFWEQLYAAAHEDNVAMLHVHAGPWKSYRLLPEVDRLLKRARLRSGVQLVSAGGDRDTIASASAVYEAVLLGANGGSATHLAALALAPDFAEARDAAAARRVVEDLGALDPEELVERALSSLSCWQHSILDFLSCMGIDDIQKTSGNNMAITLTRDWVRETDRLATRDFGRWNRDQNLERIAAEPIPAHLRQRFRPSRLLDEVVPDVDLVAAAQILAHRNANYHLMNTNRSLSAAHLEVIYRMAAGRFPEVDDFFVQGPADPWSMDPIQVPVSRKSIAASLKALRANPKALDYINLCVPRGFLRPGAVSPGAQCVLSSDAQGKRVLARFQADARGGFEVRLKEAPGEGSLYLRVEEDGAAGGAAAGAATAAGKGTAASTAGSARVGGPGARHDGATPHGVRIVELAPVPKPVSANGSGWRPAPGAPPGLGVRKASGDGRVFVRADAAGSGWVLHGEPGREPLYSGPVNHASISLGAAGEDFLLSRVEGNAGLALTSSGEGGPLRLPPDIMRWESLQAASGHFGITGADVRAVRDVEIKINQGAKPGKGGRLAGPKVTATVSKARNIPVGTDALSPDPKHDIYSIEDMPAEVWLWLHYGVHCGIKITGSTYTKYVAAGMWSNFVVDYLLVDAGIGGSGNYHADSSRVGWPDIFRTILHTHHALMHEPLWDEAHGVRRPIRDGNGAAFGALGGTKLLASGGLRSEMDMLKVLLAGADGLLEGSIGKAVAFGCNQCGNCHLDCPRGGITTKAELTLQNDRATMRTRFRNWTALNMVKLAVLMDAINRERGWVNERGKVVSPAEVLDDIRKLRGRTDLLTMPVHPEPETAPEAPDLDTLDAAIGREHPPVVADDVGTAPGVEPATETEHDSCRVGSLLVSEPVDVQAIWEAARLSMNGGNNRGGGLAFAGFAPAPVRDRTALVINTLGPDRAETLERMLDHMEGLRFFDATGRELPHEEVRLRLPEFRVPVRAEFDVPDGWQRAGLLEDVGDVTLLFTELRGDALWRYGRQLIASPHWVQRRTKYAAWSDDDLRAAIDRAVRRAEPFRARAAGDAAGRGGEHTGHDAELDATATEAPELLAFLRDVKEEYYMTLAHLLDTRYYATSGPPPKFAERRSGYVVSMGEDMASIKISGWTHLIPAYFDFDRFWERYPGARESEGVRYVLRGEDTWTSALMAHVWGMHHRYPTNSPAIDAEGRGNPAGAHPFKAYNVLLMHNGEQVGVDATAPILEEHGRVHVDPASMGEGAEDYAGDSLYARKALTDTEYAAYLVDFTRRVLGLATDDATQVISPITGLDLERVEPAERRERYRMLSRNYVQLTPTGPYKFTVVETRHAADGTPRVGFRENMDIKFLRPHEIAVNWDGEPGGVRVVANGSEAKIADAMLEVLRQQGLLADAGSDLRFSMRPGGAPESGEMGGVFESFLDVGSRDVALVNRFGEPVPVERAGSKPPALRGLSAAVAAARPAVAEEARERLRQLGEDGPDNPEARERFTQWVLRQLGGWGFDEYRDVVEHLLPKWAAESDTTRAAALDMLTEIRKRVHLVDTGGKSLATLQYFADGGFEYDGEPEGGIYRVLHATPHVWETRAAAGFSRIDFGTRLDLTAPADPEAVLVVDLGGFRSEDFGIESAARFVSEAVRLGWRRLIGYNCRGGPRYLATNTADAEGRPAQGVRLDLYGRQVGDFLGALLEGAEVRCYGQAQSHVGMKADRGTLFVLQDILNTGFYAAHGGTLSTWDSGSRFAVAGQNRVFEEDGTTLAPGLRSIHFGSPNEYAFEYLMSGGDNSLHVVMGLEKPDGRGELRLRPRPYAGKFFMSGAAAGRVYVFDPQRGMRPAQYHGNSARPVDAEEWDTVVGPFLAEQAALRDLPLTVVPGGMRLRLEGDWRDYPCNEAFVCYEPIRIPKRIQRQGVAPPALVGMVPE